jgi:hypothetical protein
MLGRMSCQVWGRKSRQQEATMPANPFPDLENEWSASSRSFFAVETDILLSNPSDSMLFFTTSADTATPVVGVRHCNPVSPKSARAMTMPAGTYLWLGGDGAIANIET